MCALRLQGGGSDAVVANPSQRLRKAKVDHTSVMTTKEATGTPDQFASAFFDVLALTLFQLTQRKLKRKSANTRHTLLNSARLRRLASRKSLNLMRMETSTSTLRYQQKREAEQT